MMLWPFVTFHGITLLITSSLLPSSHSTNSTDHEALVAFKQQISSDPFHVLDAWNQSLNYCQWQGVTCSRRHPQRIVALQLKSRGLVGSISPFIGNLSFLRTLNLENNSFHGEIPLELSRLSRLWRLILYNNSIGGEIPKNISHQMKGLRWIDLGANMLTGQIPNELGLVTSLQILYLARNNLVGTIPPSLGNISSLTNLFLPLNSLHGSIPGELGQLKNLQRLILDQNKYSGVIPPSLFNLSSLAAFSVASNQLNGSLPPNLGDAFSNLLSIFIGGNRVTGTIPYSISNASKLERLDFSANQLSGAIPRSIRELIHLKILNLEDNMLGGKGNEDTIFLASLTNCTQLETLALGQNQLKGTLTSAIANLSSSLEVLYLGANQWSGRIPFEISNLFNLYGLRLAYNNLVGTIPDSIGKLNKLQSLALYGNRFASEIPASIGNLTKLFEFDVSGNNLHGSIPSSISNCKQLLRLFLDSCNFSGTLPKQLFEIQSIQLITISRNSFKGSLPMEIGSLKSLQMFRASDNKLSGEIPNSLEKCDSLEKFYIDGNSFEGIIPPLSFLKGLTEMDISRNKLIGQIPEYLENFEYLRYLNLSFNDLEGKVPKGGVFKNSSRISIIGNPRLCGGNSELLLPPCSNKEQKRHKSSRMRTIAILIGAILSLILVSLFFFLFRLCKRKSKERSSPIPRSLENKFLIVSYLDLSRATDGFSSTNLIGTGSYSSVYKGTFHANGMVVAIKVLDPQCQGAFKSFLAECKALRDIRHRNLLRVLSACSSVDSKGDDFKALVFEYMANGNLDHWLHMCENERHENRCLSLIQRLNIVMDVASALDYLHNFCEKPIVHCDLKPSNILLDNEMNAHVCDFGLAKFLFEGCTNSSQSATSSNIRGTIGYIPPEYGSGVEASTLGDMYSFGVVLLEIFIGKKPTHELFNESLSLHQYAKSALPNYVMDIIDPRLIPIDAGAHEEIGRLDKCLTSIIRIGVVCSEPNFANRMGIRVVIAELQAIKNSYHKAEINQS